MSSLIQVSAPDKLVVCSMKLSCVRYAGSTDNLLGSAHPAIQYLLLLQIAGHIHD